MSQLSLTVFHCKKVIRKFTKTTTWLFGNNIITRENQPWDGFVLQTNLWPLLSTLSLFGHSLWPYNAVHNVLSWSDNMINLSTLQLTKFSYIRMTKLLHAVFQLIWNSAPIEISVLGTTLQAGCLMNVQQNYVWCFKWSL